MELSKKTKGNISELKIALKLIEKGCTVSFPYGENCRYDMIADFDNVLYKIQVKTGRYENGHVLISLQSIKSYRNSLETTNVRESYIDQVDYIGSYCPQLDKCYMISLEQFKHLKSSIMLRVDPARNNQQKGTIPAEQYEI